MEVNMSQNSSVIIPDSLKLFVQCLKKVSDPRSKRGQSHRFLTILAIVVLGLLANLGTLAEIQRWAEQQHPKLKTFLRFRKLTKKEKKNGKGNEKAVPHAITLARVLKNLSLEDSQKAFAAFLNAILQETTLVGAVDGKTAKQMKDENGDPIHMLNVFAQTYKLHLASWSVKGDKTNEPGCLNKHLGELFGMFPCLTLLTGDAMFAQRPLLEAIREYERDYLVQVKDNQSNVMKKMEEVFKDAPSQSLENTRTHDRKVSKKRGLLRYVVCG
jgi:hypothetical protein